MAQSGEVPNRFFATIGTGFSDYTGDFPAQNSGHPFDFQDFVRPFSGTASGFPFMTSSEFGYRYSQKLSAVLGLVGGSFPIVGYGGRSGLADTYRYTFQLLGRYTFGNPNRGVDPYVDGGFNVTVGGFSGAYGPSLGGGVNIPFNTSVSFFVESRFNFTYPDDALDGSEGGNSIIGGLDMVNQLLGVGLRVNFGGFSKDAGGARITSARAAPDTVVRRVPRGQESTTSLPDTSRYEDMVLIPNGTFVMGLTDEDPLSLQTAGRKRVTVSSFYIDQYEVTNAEYRKYLSQLSAEERQQRLPDSTAWAQARTQESFKVYFRSDYYSDYPVVGVTWNEARAYCQAQNKRLPTEAEWEYAARGGHTGRVYPWKGIGTQNAQGKYLANFNPSGNYTADGYAFTAPVDAFPPNDWGLYNVAGNVAEWTRDAYTPSYANLSGFNPVFTSEKESPRHVIRGGAWNSNSFYIGVGVRDTQPEDQATADVGFRCARERTTLPEQTSPTESDTTSQQDPAGTGGGNR